MKLLSYIKLLLEWNEIHNLSGKLNLQDLKRQVLASIYPRHKLAPFKTCLDIGTGAGLPALPLSIVFPKSHFYLVEPRLKRASFLNYVKLKLGLDNISIYQKRIQECEFKNIDLITSRAVGDLDLILDLSAHIATKTTNYLLYKSSSFEESTLIDKDLLVKFIMKKCDFTYVYFSKSF
ncbi:16S rRNA (guanine(527)-N(7))-methyltransferase RsmG [Helicobacter sp. 11S02629-2]|uniref:16S rRNA (guanine(527)-N(7))-methyltransferase RsmG n=1 Tax=Helicobacter sp. 11S02629-2 TaxID=1476195 RepID=UPI000BA5B660|nr:16S rRNA (guanine(527)-N(7))-methyltransferase RsmG [Helicobacter sp. 11S02629-2]PAF45519.1 16S rRNA (guanine(527)-N(7))-methyltransferase RsmG [Helicobacter sp. 11S02629-2]